MTDKELTMARMEEATSRDLESEVERCWKEMFPIEWSETSLLTLTYDQHMAFARHFANWQKERMMRDSVELTVYDGWEYGKDPDRIPQPTIKYKNKSLKIGDRVKLLIIKED